MKGINLILSFAAICGINTSYAHGAMTDPLDQDLWNESEWISVVNAPVVEGKIKDGSRAADGANWFATSITNPKEVENAKWMATSLGVFDIYVNGQCVGDEILKPGFTHPEKTRIAYTYDITEMIDRNCGATNQFCSEVTPGWWADKIVTPKGHDGMLGRKCAFRSVIELTYTDGTKQVFGTGTDSWTAAIAGPVQHAAIFDGEVYDARLPQGYEVVDSFTVPEINTEFNGRILPTVGAEVYARYDLSLKPTEIYVWDGVENTNDDEYGNVVIKRRYQTGETITLNPGETLVVDFGQNSAAVPNFTFKAKEGTKLNCVVGELLNDGNGAKSRGMDGPEGSVHRLNLRIPNEGMSLDYTFADGNKVSYMPRHTFYGYRFVSITADDTVEIESIESVPISSMTEALEIGNITTGNDLVNKLISNTLWGQRSNYLSVPTDCPQRNERLGWTADTQVFAETGTFFADTRPFFHKWLQDMRDTQKPNGAFTGVAPLAQYGDEGMRVGWADAGVIVPWTIWKQFGDTEVVDESWESMERFMDLIDSTKYDHNAHIDQNGNYQWADWLSYEPLESCSGQAHQNRIPKPEAIDYWNYLCASYWLIDAGMMRDMAMATGRDADKYSQMADRARAYIQDTFFDNDGRFNTEILNTMQTPALFALKNNIVEGEAKQRMIEGLRQNFADHNGCLQTGFLGTSILMPTLSENGLTDVAYDLLFQRKNPSWLYSIDNGATTIWERWNSYMTEHGMGPRGMNSFNHYAYGCVCEWIWETAAGISADPNEPGFKHIIMKPQPDRRLGSVDAVYNSAAGPISSSWHYEGDEWHWTFSVPEGATASVTLPGRTEPTEYGPGTYSVKQ